MDEGTTTQEEMLTFVETLTSHEYKKIKQFLDTMSELKHTIKLKNPNTKFEFQYTVRGITDFFRLVLRHSSLEKYMKDSMDLVYYHKWNFYDIDNMLPWELDTYLILLGQRVDEENKKREQARKAHGF